MGRAYVRLFADAILEENEPAITPEDGVAALRVVEAIHASDSAKRRTAVTESKKGNVA